MLFSGDWVSYHESGLLQSKATPCVLPLLHAPLPLSPQWPSAMSCVAQALTRCSCLILDFPASRTLTNLSLL
jgi:hypothetical protein